MVDKKLKRAVDIVDSKIDDEVVMMHVEKGSYFGLNAVGSKIWEILENQTLTPIEIAKQLTEIYDVPLERCLTDIEPFIRRMVRNGMLIEVDNKAS